MRRFRSAFLYRRTHFDQFHSASLIICSCINFEFIDKINPPRERQNKESDAKLNRTHNNKERRKKRMEREYKNNIEVIRYGKWLVVFANGEWKYKKKVWKYKWQNQATNETETESMFPANPKQLIVCSVYEAGAR